MTHPGRARDSPPDSHVGASNFFALAVALAITFFGPTSLAAFRHVRNQIALVFQAYAAGLKEKAASAIIVGVPLKSFRALHS